MGKNWFKLRRSDFDKRSDTSNEKAWRADQEYVTFIEGKRIFNWQLTTTIKI